MTAIICIDNHNGILFNHRRQSQDRFVREHVLHMISSDKLWMNSYTKKQFTEENAQIIIDENFLNEAAANDYCFVENVDIAPYIDKIDKIILFKWNRNYPADIFFSIDLTQWTLEQSEDFAGYSHDKITKEIYRK